MRAAPSTSPQGIREGCRALHQQVGGRRSDLGSARRQLELGHGIQGTLRLIARHTLQLVQGGHQQLGSALQRVQQPLPLLCKQLIRLLTLLRIASTQSAAYFVVQAYATRVPYASRQAALTVARACGSVIMVPPELLCGASAVHLSCKRICAQRVKYIAEQIWDPAFLTPAI